MQHIDIIARTFEIGKIAELSGRSADDINKDMIRDLQILSGKAAGVCYMPDDYFEDGIQNEEKALKRVENTSKSGHHSVYEHGHITMIIKTDKMMAMILNSVGVYATSEKSARYTKMKPSTELELNAYTKWRDKIQQLILAKYPDIDDDMLSARLCKKMGIEKSMAVINGGCSHIKDDEFLENELNELKKSDTLPSYKLAQENARYMISVFTPTTLEYTVSYRQLILISDYMELLIKECECLDTVFDKQLRESAQSLLDEVNRILGDKPFRDNKNQYFRFLIGQHIGEIQNGKFSKYSNDRILSIRQKKKDILGDSYTVSYYGSLAMLAQAQRHRSIRYSMLLDYKNVQYYVPEIIKEYNLTDEWLRDIKALEYCVPQGTLVRITEQGLFEDFVLKCKERMCGRAQLEIMLSTKEITSKFIDNFSKLSLENLNLLTTITDKSNGLQACARCKFKDFKCTEGCKWGANEALTRKI